MNVLKFSQGNSKLSKDTAIFSLLAGHSCPGAMKCKAFVTLDENGRAKVNNGPETEFRCYAANAEALYPNTYKARLHNYELMKNLRTTEEMVDLILTSLASMKFSGEIKFFRVHESGDFFTLKYFKAWMIVASKFPNIRFYSYTKSIPHLVKGIKEGIIPDNYTFTASYGGKFDYLIEEHGLKNVKVVMSEDEAKKMGLPIDHDDSHAQDGDGDFALLIHGMQPKGTQAALAWDKMVKGGIGGYKKNGQSKRKAA